MLNTFFFLIIRLQIYCPAYLDVSFQIKAISDEYSKLPFCVRGTVTAENGLIGVLRCPGGVHAGFVRVLDAFEEFANSFVDCAIPIIIKLFLLSLW